MKFRVGIPLDQPLALPARVDDWIPPHHLVRIIDQVVDVLDLSAAEHAFHDQGAGAPAYAPKMLLKLLAYGYLTQRFSSRRISQACQEDLGFMWLARLEHPHHSILAAFRQQHVAELPEWLAQVILLCMDLGMVGWKLGALDGSKIHADASKHQAMSYGRMQEVIPKLEAELETIVAAHGAADDQVPPVPNVSPLPADHEDRVRQRLAAIKQARAELKARWAADHPEEDTEAEPPAGTQINFTDPDSHIMVTKNQGVQQAYNTQIVVDAQDGIIVGATVSAHPNDMEEVTPALDSVARLTGQMFEKLVLDAGYFSAANVTQLIARDVDAYIAAGPNAWRTIHGQKLFGKGQFVYQPATDTFDCPAHHPLAHHGDRQEEVGGGAVRMVGIYRGDRATCGACPLKDQCLTAKQSTKHLTRGADDAVRDAMKAKVRSVEGDTLYRRRKGIVEPVFGILKETLGFRQWSLRGLKKVTGELALLVMAYNIRKLAAKLRQLGAEAPAVWQGTRPVAA
jgi:transposase